MNKTYSGPLIGELICPRLADRRSIIGHGKMLNRQACLAQLSPLFSTLALLISLCAAASASSVGPLSVPDVKAICRLCSDLSHEEVASFPKGGISNDALIHFGVLYNYNEKPKRCVMPHYGTGYIAAGYVAQAAADYFGKPVHNRSTKDFRYSGGSYHFSLGDGGDDSPDDYQVHSCTRESDGTYSVTVKSVDRETHHLDSGPRLTLKRKIQNGVPHFIVISYHNHD